MMIVYFFVCFYASSGSNLVRATHARNLISVISVLNASFLLFLLEQDYPTKE